MNGLFVLLLLLAAGFGLVVAMGVRGAILKLAAAALMLGAAGYALQGRPGLGSSPRAVSSNVAPIPLTRIRQVFYGSFTPSERWFVMSQAYAQRGQTAEAVGVMRAAIREHPADATLWVGLGNALVDHAGVLTPASQLAYQRALTLAPDHPAAPFFLGFALARSGDRDGALRVWRDLLARAPADAGWRPLVEDAVAALAAARS